MGNILCDLDHKFKVKCQIMYFFVNAPPLKMLLLQTLQLIMLHEVEGT